MRIILDKLYLIYSTQNIKQHGHVPAHMQHTKILLYVPVNCDQMHLELIFTCFIFGFVAELWFNECPVYFVNDSYLSLLQIYKALC